MCLEEGLENRAKYGSFYFFYLFFEKIVNSPNTFTPRTKGD